MEDQQQFCRNCNTLLQGEFCAQCGQREGRGDVHLGEVAGELADDFLHWDSRIWRTLIALLFRPGFLTAEFIAGRKAGYVPAFRLYLIVSFVLFLVLSLESGSIRIETTPPIAPAVTGTGLDTAATANSESLGDAAAGADGTVALDQRVDIDLADENSPQWLKDLEQRLKDNAKRIEKEPGDFMARLLEYLPQTMFVLLPLFAVIVRLCYLFSPFHYLQHLVFSLHFHSFVYLLSLLGSLSERVLPDGINGLLFLLVFPYLPLALRRAYGSSMPGAIGKSLLIIGADAVLLIFGFAGAALFTLAMF